MAQIIKHRRGSLESISGATKRAGELLVVTGSTGITADNGDSILFVGVDGSTATPANKVLQGATNPDLTGASYDTSIDGIPFYNTQTEKLYILNKGGNVEIKATANTGGTGIVSGSAQVKELLPAGSISGSTQVDITSAQGYTALEGRVSTNETNISSNTSDIQTINTTLDGIATEQTNQNNRLTALEDEDVAQAAINDSVSSDLNDLFDGQTEQNGRLTTLEAFSSSLDATFATDASVTSLSSSLKANVVELFSSASDHEGRIDTIEASIGGASGIGQRVSSLEAFSGSQESKDSTLASYTASVDAHISALNAFSASQLDKDSTLASYTASVDAHISAVNSFSASQLDKDSTLASYTASVDTTLSNIATDQATQDGRLDSLEGFQSDVETAIAFDGQNVTINGNFTVSGTQTIVDSTTVQIGDNIIELNGSSAANGGLLVKDATNPNTVSGSLLWDSTNDYWKAGAQGAESKVLVAGGDSVVSGSSQINLADVTGNNTDNVSEGEGNLYYTDARVKTKLNAEGVISGSSQVNADSITNFDANVLAYNNSLNVISGSSQVTIGDTTGYNDFSSSIATAISASVAASTWENLNGKPSGIVSGSSQVVDYLVSQNIAVAGISGSSLNITGNAKIDGNVVIGGNITVGDANTDTVSFSADLTSDILVGTDNTYDLGSSTKGFANVYATNLYGSVNATNGVISGSSQVNADSITNFDSNVKDALNVEGVISGSSQVNADSITNFDSNVKDKLNAEGVISGSVQVLGGTGIISGSSQLDGTTIDSANLTNVTADGIFSGTFSGDGSALTGLVTALDIAGDTGTGTVDLLTDTLSVLGGEGIDVSVSGGTITIAGEDASTSNKGVASFDADDFAVSSGNVSIKAGGVRATNLNADVVGEGLSLDGTDNSINVDYGATAGTAVEGNTSLIVEGTAGEITISGGNVTLGNGGTITIGLPDDVTISNTLTVNGDVVLGGSSTDSVTIAGNLFVQGTTTTVDSTTIQLGDNIIELNGSGAANGGLLVKDATNPNTASGSLLWDSTNDFWKAGALGLEKEVARIDSSISANTVLKSDANGLLVNTTITDDGTDVSITGDFTIGGLSAANAFLYADGSKTLQSVAPQNAGDMIQWNGSSFVASNTVDGGTF